MFTPGLSKDIPAYNKVRHASMRRRAMEKIQGTSNLVCIKCGCSEYKLLEINHVDGGGRKERLLMKGENIYALILNNKRTVKDLDIRCKMCNILYFIELKYGIEVSERYKLLWN